jgi:DNA-binding transcriptional LysR family regulator
MEIRLFEYVLEIYKDKSFTRAAEHLHIAQPSLSKQIAKLERELGVTLFERKPGCPVEPTPDGLVFVKQAEKILQMRDDLKREILERKEGIKGKLTIGSTAITGGHVLPPILKTYKEQYPNVRIDLIEESTEKLIDLTARGLVDISILSLPIEDSRLNTIPMLTEPLYLVLPKEQAQWMPLMDYSNISTTQNTLPIADFANCPFILLKQGFGFRRTVLELCARAGFEPQIAYETSSIETAQSLVGHGLGITIVPEMVIRQSAYQSFLTYFKLDSNPTRTLVFTYKKERYLSMNARALVKSFENIGLN